MAEPKTQRKMRAHAHTVCEIEPSTPHYPSCVTGACVVRESSPSKGMPLTAWQSRGICIYDAVHTNSVNYKMPNPRFQALRNARLELGCLLNMNWLHLSWHNMMQSLKAWSRTVFLQGLCFIRLTRQTCLGMSLTWAPKTQDCNRISWKVSNKGEA